MVGLSAAQLSLLPEEAQLELLKKLHATTPPFRRFTMEE